VQQVLLFQEIKAEVRLRPAVNSMLLVVGLALASILLPQIIGLIPLSPIKSEPLTVEAGAFRFVMFLTFWTLLLFAARPLAKAAKRVIFANDETDSIWLFTALIAIIGIFYVSLAITPSHYAIGLQVLGFEHKPLLFAAQGIRSDEWAVLTPLFQTAVRGGHAAYNQVSPYHEALKGFWALPILDWSLIFKPQLWGFWLLPPAYAYSLYFATLWIAFLVGYTILLVQLGATPRIAALGATCLLLSGFVQVWWTSNAPTFAFAPWPAIIFLLTLRPSLKFPLLFWTCAVWIFSFVYPPFIIAEAFALGVLIAAFRRDALTLPNILVAAGAITMLGICFIWYFGGLIQIMQATIYPGSRISSGGGVELSKLISHFLPFFATMNFTPLYDTNACEVQVVSSVLPLALICMVNFHSLISMLRRERMAWCIVGIGLAMMLAWVFIPVPSWVGSALLWTHVPPYRMIWGLGLLFTLSVTLICSKCPFEFSPKRVAAFVLIMLGGWLTSKLGHGLIWQNASVSTAQVLLGSTYEWVAIIAFLVSASLAKKYKVTQFALNRMFMLSAVYTGLLTFGTFNPFQQAYPIFDIPKTPFLEAAREKADTSPNGWAVVPGLGGALLSGAGIPAINHTLRAPELVFFRNFFPDLPESEFNQIFNRYAHIVPVEGLAGPVLKQNDVIRVPASAFDKGKPD
jgi:hypothetical protein